MAQFPTREAEISALAQQMIAGLKLNTDVYPEPPVPADALQQALETYLATREEATTARAASGQATEIKNEALDTLTDQMKSDIRYAENTVGKADDRLNLIGWAGPRDPQSLQPPGQTRSLEAPREGEGWIFLDWKAPADGGVVAAYKIQRRLRADGAWTDVGMAIESELTLHNQERGQEWEYRVMAVNKAGDGEPSNVVMAVL